MSKEKYLEAIEVCVDKLKNTDDINYVLCVCNAVPEGSDMARGGQAWNICADGDEYTMPDFATMVGNLIENYIDNVGCTYTEKLKFIRELNTGLLKHITDGAEKEDGR